MILYPAIDLYGGKVVRLKRGDFAAETVYSDNPPEQAAEWENCGADWIHVVDLAGAKTGEMQNRDVIESIRKKVSLRMQVGGGIRSAETVNSMLGIGIDRVVLGTKALDEKFFSKMIELHGDKIAVGLDVRDGEVKTEGWLKGSGARLEEALKVFNEYPLKTIIYTDIKMDGMLQGPNFQGLQDVLAQSKANIILSGGISGISDIEKASTLKYPNFDGVIIGKALYDKKLDLKNALSISKP